MKFFYRFVQRFIFVLLLISMLLGVLVSCKAGAGKESTDTTSLADDSVSLNGIPLTEYTVVYPWSDNIGEKKIAYELQKAIQMFFGVQLNVMVDYDGVPQKAIVVGDVKNTAMTSVTTLLEVEDWCLTADENHVYLLAKSEYGFQKALEDFLTVVNVASENKIITVLKSDKKSYRDKKMTTMTFNIRNWDTTTNHLQRIRYVIKNNMPDVIGFQEMSNKSGYEWVNKLMADAEIATMYGYIGESRADSTEEQVPIFYRKDKFTVVESDTRWLYCLHGIKCSSDACIGEDTPGNFSKELQYNRIYTYARLKRISDGKEMTFINTHLETSGTEYQGVKVQTKEIDYILNFAQKLTQNGETVVLTGDFNGQLTGEPCIKTLNSGFQSAERMSQNKIGAELPQGAMYESENRAMTRLIDHVFIASENCVFETYTYFDEKINIRGKLDYPSDHIPRMATYIVE